MTSVCVVINQSKHITNAEVQAMLPAINQWSQLVSAAWDAPSVVTEFQQPGATLKPTFGVIYLQDGLSNAPGAAGYHDVEGGRPVGRIDVQGTLAAGMSLSVTFCHELAEMMEDAWCFWGAPITRTKWVAGELCDAVEADQYAILIGGVKCSNFVLPAYFAAGSMVGPWDYGHHLTGPAPAMLPGGYLSIWSATGGWTQITKDEQLPYRAVNSRRHALRVANSESLPE